MWVVWQLLATSRVETIQKANVTKAWQKLAKYWINEKEAAREQERDRASVKKSWSTGAWLSTLTDFRVVTVLCVGHFVLGLVSFFAKLLGSDFIFPPLSLSLSLSRSCIFAKLFNRSSYLRF